MAKQHSIEKRWYSNAEAEMYTGFSKKHLENARKAGQITFHVQKESNRPLICFEKQHLDEFMERKFKKIECITDFQKTLRK